MSDDVLYSNRTPLFALKGHVAIYFLDGDVLQGEFVTQDAYNLFIKVDGEPVMIPRQQVKMIKGLHGQTIEPDTTQSDTLPEPIPMAPEPSPVPLPPAPQPHPMLDDDDDEDGTLILVQESRVEEDEDSQTMILETHDDFLAMDIPELEKEEELDMTVVLGGSVELPDLASTEPDKAKELTAQLVCVGGPHSGQVFSLKSGINTIGRSSDNAVALSSDKEISRHHAIVLHESGKFVVQDQNSLNGTFVNDEQITGPRYLENGDLILVGVTTFEYQEE